MDLFAKRVGLIDTENAFKIRPLIRAFSENTGIPTMAIPWPEFTNPALDKDATIMSNSIGVNMLTGMPGRFMVLR
jgi:hypothetical protein